MDPRSRRLPWRSQQRRIMLNHDHSGGRDLHGGARKEETIVRPVEIMTTVEL